MVGVDLDVGDAQSAARKPPAKPEAQWNNSGLVSIKWILSGFVCPDCER
jgi:hypothetical protein